MESKTGEGKDDNDGDHFIEELVKFTNTSNYVEKCSVDEKVQDFMTKNCSGFETYHERLASGEGNKLEWMDVFNEFQAIIDRELDDFCEMYGISVSEGFRTIEKYINEAEDEEFIPIFLKTMNEEHFFEQMYSCASQAAREDAAIETSENEEKGEVSMSGIWYFVPESMDVDDLNVWLNVLGMPWPFKKLFQSAHKKPMKAVIKHVPGAVFDICIAIPFFGNNEFHVKLNGEWSEGKDRMGRKLKLFGEEGENGDVTLHVRDRGGALMMIFFSMTGPNSVRVYREFYANGVDSGTPNADATLRCTFRK